MEKYFDNHVGNYPNERLEAIDFYSARVFIPKGAMLYLAQNTYLIVHY